MQTQRISSVSSQFELTTDTISKLKDFDITPVSKLVLLYLTTCYNPSKVDVFPKQSTIAEVLGISERSVIRAIQDLISNGLIMVVTGKSNRYKFTSKIFDIDKLSYNKCQNDTSTNDKLTPLYIEQKREQIKNKNSFKTNFVSEEEKIKIKKSASKRIEETKKIIEENKNFHLTEEEKLRIEELQKSLRLKFKR